MNTKVGLWIDHREANILFMWEGGEVMKRIKSNVEKQIRRTGDSPADEPYEAQLAPASDQREKGYTGHLANYYEEIVSAIRGAGSIFIFGPGEAKGEFRKHLEKHNLGKRITGFETADKMTKPQVAAKARDFYLTASSRSEY